MNERLAVCQALAAMIRQHGAPSEEEVTFIGMAALQLGLSDDENAAVQQTLKEGGDYGELVGEITSKPMRTFFFRRMLAAVLLDEQINEQEHAVIEVAQDAFGIDSQQTAEMIAWLKVGVEVEKQLNALLTQI